MKHFEKRIEKMTQKAVSRSFPAGMFIRIVFLVLILAVGKFSCEWAVKKSVEHPKESWELRRTGEFDFKRGTNE